MSPSLFTAERLLFTPAVPRADATPVVFAFPNQYQVGITSLGYQGLWAALASRTDVAVSRLFTDGHEPLPRQPALVGFSLSWELDYSHIFALLELLGIPRRSQQRQESDPLVFGGGSVLTGNPEPLADFFDLVLLGDGEKLLGDLISTYRDLENASRFQKLQGLAQVPGIYVPSLYQVTYDGPTGPVTRIEAQGAPPQVHKQTYRGSVLCASTVVTAAAAWENIYMVEVVRSCPEMCRFCLASYLNLPFRPASLESLIDALERGLKVTDRLGLLGASITQHPEFEALLDFLDLPKHDGVRLSLASVRTNTLTERLAALLVKRHSHSATIAIESGSPHIRQLVNKKLEDGEILQAAVNAKAGGLTNLKLYTMVGVPGETTSDLQQTVDLVMAIKRAAPGLRLTLGCSTFVPKAHTPWQWYGVRSAAQKRLPWLQKQLQSQGVEFRPESYQWSVIQALISRGDRRVSHILEQSCSYGDSLGSYRRGAKDLRAQVPDLDYYVHQDWQPGVVLPWSHLQAAMPESTLQKHLAL